MKRRLLNVFLFLPQLLLASTSEKLNPLVYVFIALLILIAFIYFAQRFTVWVFIRIRNMKQAHRAEKRKQKKEQ